MTTRSCTTTVLGLTLGGLLLAGCSRATDPATAAPTASPTSATGSATSSTIATDLAPLEGTRWGLFWYERRTPAEVFIGSAAAGTEPAIVVTDGNIVLDAQCNGISGDVTVTDATLTVSQLSMTELACTAGRGDMEKLLTDAFTGTVGYTLANDTLTVKGAAEITLTFVPITEGGGIPGPAPDPYATLSTGRGTDATPVPATPIDGTWRLSGYTDPSGGHAVPDGVRPDIILRAGRIAVDAQCNAIGGDVAVADTTLTITGMMSTLVSCAEPQRDMEALLIDALADTVDYTLSDGVLTVTGPSTTLTFDRVAPAPPTTAGPATEPFDPAAETLPADAITVPPAR